MEPFSGGTRTAAHTDSAQPSNYTEVGRAAVRAFLARTSGRPNSAAAAEVVLQRSVPLEYVRLWILDDLMPDRRIERIARLACPELAEDFAALDRSREAARQERTLVLVGREVDRAMRNLQWPGQAA